MIYGNPLIFGGSGGGGPSASDAILTVTVPTGSTVTMTKGGTTLTPTMWVQAADPTLDCALFVLGPSLFDAQNAWTVTASLSGDTASDTVTIDSNEQYSLELSYHVPSGYQEVVYITFPSGSYINTGANSNFSIYTEIKLNDPSYAQDKHYLGTAGSAEEYQITTYNYKYYWNIGSRETSAGTWTAGIKTVEYNNASENYAFKVNGTTLGSGTAASTSNREIYIGRRGNAANFVGDVYYCFMTSNSSGKLVRELYPCYRISDSVVGFWDKIGKTFYTNAGSGTLVAGPDVN